MQKEIIIIKKSPQKKNKQTKHNLTTYHPSQSPAAAAAATAAASSRLCHFLPVSPQPKGRRKEATERADAEARSSAARPPFALRLGPSGAARAPEPPQPLAHPYAHTHTEAPRHRELPTPFGPPSSSCWGAQLRRRKIIRRGGRREARAPSWSPAAPRREGKAPGGDGPRKEGQPKRAASPAQKRLSAARAQTRGRGGSGRAQPGLRLSLV